MIMMMIRVWDLGFKGLIKSDNHPAATPHNSAPSIHWQVCYDSLVHGDETEIKYIYLSWVS
jgi:hypothetical protein